MSASAGRLAFLFGTCHAAAIARHRLARDVPAEHVICRSRVFNPPQSGRTRTLNDTYGARTLVGSIPATAGKGPGHNSGMPWFGDSLLGAKLRLLRRDDLATKLSLDQVRL